MNLINHLGLGDPAGKPTPINGAPQNPNAAFRGGMPVVNVNDNIDMRRSLSLMPMPSTQRPSRATNNNINSSSNYCYNTNNSYTYRPGPMLLRDSSPINRNFHNFWYYQTPRRVRSSSTTKGGYGGHGGANTNNYINRILPGTTMSIPIPSGLSGAFTEKTAGPFRDVTTIGLRNAERGHVSPVRMVASSSP